MSVPLLAVDVKHSDYEWTAPMPEPEKLQIVQPPTQPVLEPTTPSLPRMRIVPGPISYEDLAANVREYDEALMKLPNWQELLAAKSREIQEARREARRLARRKHKEKAA
jgi:hypothetical protein